MKGCPTCVFGCLTCQYIKSIGYSSISYMFEKQTKHVCECTCKRLADVLNNAYTSDIKKPQ